MTLASVEAVGRAHIENEGGGDLANSDLFGANVALGLRSKASPRRQSIGF